MLSTRRIIFGLFTLGALATTGCTPPPPASALTEGTPFTAEHMTNWGGLWHGDMVRPRGVVSISVEVKSPQTVLVSYEVGSKGPQIAHISFDKTSVTGSDARVAGNRLIVPLKQGGMIVLTQLTPASVKWEHIGPNAPPSLGPNPGVREGNLNKSQSPA